MKRRGAEEGSRTPTPLRAEDFESSASASSATSARSERSRFTGRAPAGERSSRLPPRMVAKSEMRHRGERDDVDTLVNLNARVPRHLWRRVRLQCLREERLLRSFITEALREYLRDRSGRRAS
jgi:hypothetical protein